jgi:hypothetical protein
VARLNLASYEMGRLRIDLQFHPHDWWIGVYHDSVDVVRQSDKRFAPASFERRDHKFWLCLLPLLPIKFTWKGRERWQTQTARA